MLKPNNEVEKVFDEIGELRQIRKTLERKSPHWTDHFRILTPIGLAVVGYFLSVQTSNFNRLDVDIKDMRLQIDHHLQNSELHVPRNTVVSKDEFELAQRSNDRQISDIKTSEERRFADLQCYLIRIENKIDEKLK